jgi:hypothetical protein
MEWHLSHPRGGSAGRQVGQGARHRLCVTTGSSAPSGGSRAAGSRPDASTECTGATVSPRRLGAAPDQPGAEGWQAPAPSSSACRPGRRLGSPCTGAASPGPGAFLTSAQCPGRGMSRAVTWRMMFVCRSGSPQPCCCPADRSDTQVTQAPDLSKGPRYSIHGTPSARYKKVCRSAGHGLSFHTLCIRPIMGPG